MFEKNSYVKSVHGGEYLITKHPQVGDRVLTVIRLNDRSCSVVQLPLDNINWWRKNKRSPWKDVSNRVSISAVYVPAAAAVPLAPQQQTEQPVPQDATHYIGHEGAGSRWPCKYHKFIDGWLAFWSERTGMWVKYADQDMESKLNLVYLPAPLGTQKKPELTGSSVDYYKVPIRNVTTDCNETKEDDVVYVAECNDIMEALNMNHTESNIFKEIWRTAAARTLGKEKQGHTALYGAQKVKFFAQRLLERVENGY